MNNASEDFEDITIETFDAPGEKHSFSRRYRRQKRANLKAFRAGERSHSGARRAVITAAALACAITLTFGANAASNGALFDGTLWNRIWGDAGRTSVGEREYSWEDGVSVVLPGREYVSQSSEEAQELLGVNVCRQETVVDLPDTVMTVRSVICAEDCAVIEYTLHKAGGVDCLIYDELSNELKGARFSDDINYRYYFTDASGKSGGDYIFVDGAASDDETTVCYHYVLGGDYSTGMNVEVVSIDRTFSSLYEGDGTEPIETRTPVETRTVTPIPTAAPAKAVEFRAKNGATLRVSPLSMTLVDAEAFGFECTVASPYYIKITYKDGSEVTVRDVDFTLHDTADPEGFIDHDAPEDIDNTVYELDGIGGKSSQIMFNRLIDVGYIESITVDRRTLTPLE